MTVPLEALMKQVGNRYQLVLVAARRANELVGGNPPCIESKKGSKIPTVALDEISLGKVRYEATKEKKEKSGS